MTEPSLQRVKEVFLGVVETPREDQVEALAKACGDDAVLRSKVQRMLDAEQSGFMVSPVTPPIEVVSIEEPLAPERVGPYRIVELLGEGGFGSVYRAEQCEPIRREVAVKIIKPGMDTRQVINRFTSERQALATLDHPNIASVFDAGATDQGRPYFAMELIKGEPITTCCDQHQMSVAERLDLFLDVCRAVQHAHQKGLIHRDIKPTNVLVERVGAGDSARPVVKIIDFGIAKAIDDRSPNATLFTEAGQLMGTPDYMSPEQADPELGSADTRSDIYALGALLFELLTGTTPLQLARSERTGMMTVVRRICEHVPDRPSVRVDSAPGSSPPARGSEARRLASRLQGDLDWIVMRAIEKEPRRRYETVQAFASDIERHLADEPVLAGPPSKVYRARKFVRRHRVGVGIAVAAAGMLAATLATVSVTLGRALDAEQDAHVARGDTEAFNTFLLEDLIGRASPENDGHTVTVVSAIENALGSIDTRFADRPTAGARIRTTIGGVYHGLGLLEEARDAFERSSADYKSLLGKDAPETLVALTELGSVQHHLGQTENAEATLREATGRLRRVLGPDDFRFLRAQAILGENLQAQGKYDEAEGLLRNSIDGMRRIVSDDDLRLLAALGSLGALLQAEGRIEEAEPIYRDSLRMTLDNYPPGHPVCLAALNNTAVLLMNLDKPEEARPVLETLVITASESLPQGHWQVAWSRYSYAACLIDLGDDAAALPQLRLAYRDADAALGSEHFLTERALGELVAVLDRLESPESLDFNAISVATRLHAANPDQRDSVRRSLLEYLDRCSRYPDHPRASSRLRFAIERARDVPVDRNESTDRFVFNLALGLLDIGDLENARSMMLYCYQRYEARNQIEDQSSAARIAEGLSGLFELTAEPDLAQEWARVASDHRDAAPE